VAEAPPAEAPVADEAGPEDEAAQDLAPGPAISPLVLLCASLQALIYADGKVEAVENDYLTRITTDQGLIEESLEYWRMAGTRELMSEADRTLSPIQKLCLVANLLDCAMADGVFSSGEKRLIEGFRVALGIDEENFGAVAETMLLKNDLSLFDSVEEEY